MRRKKRQIARTKTLDAEQLPDLKINSQISYQRFKVVLLFPEQFHQLYCQSEQTTRF